MQTAASSLAVAICKTAKNYHITLIVEENCTKCWSTFMCDKAY